MNLISTTTKTASTAFLVLMIIVSEQSYSFQVPQTIHSTIVRSNRLIQYASTVSVDNDKTTTTTTTGTIMTGPNGKAAINFDEDLRLTLQIIMDHQLRSTTVTTEQLVQQVTAAAAIQQDDMNNVFDITIPYDAPAKLAYDQEPSAIQSSMTFDEYKVQYETKAIADVIAKKKPTVTATTTTTSTPNDESYDISVPYDAAAKLAYNNLPESERSTMDYTTFQQQFVTKAINDVIAKKQKNNQIDISSSSKTVVATTTTATVTTPVTNMEYDITVPYDAAAKLAYERIQSIKHTLSYEQFKVQYEQNSIRNVISKKLKRDNNEHVLSK